MKKLYLSSYNCNLAKGLMLLFEMIEENGGYITSEWEKTKEKTAIYDSNTNEFIVNSYFTGWAGSYINFVLDNIYYSLSFDSNSFFPDHIVKQNINNGLVNDSYVEEISKFFDYKMDDKDIINQVKKLYDYVIDHKFTNEVIEVKKHRIYNLDGSYRYGYVKKPTRTKKINKVILK